MQLTAIIKNILPVNEKITILSVHILGEDPFEKVYVTIYHSFLECESYQFKKEEVIRINLSFDSCLVNGQTATEVIADYIVNSDGQEILNRSACHFPF